MGNAIGYGWRGFTRNVGAFVVIALVIVGVEVVLGVVGTLIQDRFFLNVAWNLVTWLIGALLGLGLIRAALAVVDGGQPSADMLFRGDGFLTYLAASILVAIGVVFGLLLCIIPGLILGFLWAFFGYSIADGLTTDPIDAMKRSWALVSANVGPLLLLMLAAIGINLLGALLCLVGLLVSLPVTGVAYAYSWRLLTGGRIVPLG